MEDEKLQILKDVLGRYHRTSDEYLFYCKFCNHHKRKLSVNLKKNTYKCWICDSTGAASGLVFRFGSFEHKKQWKSFSTHVDLNDFDQLFVEQEDVQIVQKIDLPREFVPLSNSNIPYAAKAALNYLKQRNITKKTILKWKIGCCLKGDYKGRIIIPSFNDKGQCNYFIARSFGKEWPKYKNPPTSRDIVFNELNIDWNSSITLVEGVFDALVADNAIPLLGSLVREGSNFFKILIEQAKDIYLALDSDAEKKSSSLIRLLHKYNKNVYKINTSDIEDVGVITPEEFLDRKEKAFMVSREDYVFYEVLNAI